MYFLLNMGIFKCHVCFQGCMVNNPHIKALLVIGQPLPWGPGWLAWLIMSTHSWIHMGMARFTSAEIGSGGMEWPAMSSGSLFWWIEGWQSKAMHGEAHGNTLHCRTSSSLSSSTTSPVAAKTTPFTPQCTNTPYSWTKTCLPNKSTICHHSNTKAKTSSKHVKQTFWAKVSYN